MREKYKPETYTPEQVGAHVTKQTKGIIKYARETGKAGKPDDYTVEQHIEKVLYFIYNMNRQTPTKTEEEAETRQVAEKVCKIEGHQFECLRCGLALKLSEIEDDPEPWEAQIEAQEAEREVHEEALSRRIGQE